MTAAPGILNRPSLNACRGFYRIHGDEGDNVMKKPVFLAFTTALLALAWSQSAAAADMKVVNGTDKPALFTVTYYTKLCKDDRGVNVPPKGTVTLKVGACTVNT